jgi:hypothetical protein
VARQPWRPCWRCTACALPASCSGPTGRSPRRWTRGGRPRSDPGCGAQRRGRGGGGRARSAWAGVARATPQFRGAIVGWSGGRWARPPRDVGEGPALVGAGPSGVGGFGRRGAHVLPSIDAVCRDVQRWSTCGAAVRRVGHAVGRCVWG